METMETKGRLPIVLVGVSGSGKTETAQEIEKRGYSRIVTYTTRPMRKYEVNGRDYHFIDEKEFADMDQKGIFAESASFNASFGFCRYGSAKDDYQPGKVIVLNPSSVKAIKEQGIDAIVVLITADQEEIRRRLRLRGDDPVEVARREKTDAVDFAGIEKYVDFIVDTTNIPPTVVAKNVLKLL